MEKFTKVGDIMTSSIFTVNVEDTVHSADQIMKEEKIKHIPVVDDAGIFVGLITERSLMEYSLKQLYEYDDTYGEECYNKILDYRRLMKKQDYVIYPEDSVEKAVAMMSKYHLDCLPVVDWQKKLIGIVTTTDIMLFMHNKLVEDEERPDARLIRE